MEFLAMKYYLYVPYEQKDKAKRAGAKWDGYEKKWYTIYEYDKLREKYKFENFDDKGNYLYDDNGKFINKEFKRIHKKIIKEKYKPIKKAWLESYGRKGDGYRDRHELDMFYDYYLKFEKGKKENNERKI